MEVMGREAVAMAIPIGLIGIGFIGCVSVIPSSERAAWFCGDDFVG
jgi:hypothetical protein